MKKYCEECGREVETRIVTKKEGYVVCGELIEVDARVLVCEECDDEFYNEELDNETLLAAYNEYRRKHKLLFAEDIKKIREQYGLSQRSLAKLLNWGDKTIQRYENGSIQDKAHNSLLLFLRDPENMRDYINENEISFNDKQMGKLIQRIDEIEQDVKCQVKQKYFNMLFLNKPSEENGFKVFDYDKFCAMVLFFANKKIGLLKTKLLKLLNYSDMIFYKENGISISGSRYVHLSYGPVMENFDILFGKMADDNVAHIDIKYEEKYEKHQVIPESKFPEGVLSELELDVLERIYNKFADFTSTEISYYSHCEKGYASTPMGEIISYSYAKDMGNQEI